jgi:hypothetical protein
MIRERVVSLGYLDSMTDDIDELYRRLWGFYRFNGVYNASGASGLPAVTLPLHESQGGLPIGMMFGARFGNESLLFRLAGQLERAVPWGARHPTVSIWATESKPEVTGATGCGSHQRDLNPRLGLERVATRAVTMGQQ